MSSVEFKPGDLVVLKAGGPQMVVEQRIEGSTVLNMPNVYVCTWFAGAKHNSERFAEAALKLDKGNAA